MSGGVREPASMEHLWLKASPASPLGVKETHTRKKLFHASAREQIVLSGRRRGDLLLLAAQTGGCRLCHSVACS